MTGSPIRFLPRAARRGTSIPPAPGSVKPPAAGRTPLVSRSREVLGDGAGDGLPGHRLVVGEGGARSDFEAVGVAVGSQAQVDSRELQAEAAGEGEAALGQLIR